MLNRRVLKVLAITFGLLLLPAMTTRMLSVAALLPPHPTFSQVKHVFVQSTQHQIAVPHRGLLSQVRFTFIPSAQACATTFCDTSTTKPTCNDENCDRRMCGKCPDCWNGPCTIYTCAVTTTINRACKFKYNSYPPCGTCRNDTASSDCVQL